MEDTKAIKITRCTEDEHWAIKLEATKRKMTIKDFILKSAKYFIDNETLELE